ncbi:hypothetical protein Tco_0059148, partial [Tanacetum coccineum]
SRVILFGDIPTIIPSTSVVAPETSTIALVISSAAPIRRSRVTARPSSSSEFPIAPVTVLPEIRRRLAILIRPGEAIPFGRPYRTYLNGPRKLLTARKLVGPLPARRLACRHASPRSSDHCSSSSSSSLDSSPVHSSGLDASDQAHSGSSTIDSSSGDSSERPLHSSSHSAGLSRKRCRSLVDSVPSSTPRRILRLTTEVDMELGIGDGDDVRDRVEINPRDVRDDAKEYEADTSAGDTVEDGIVRSFEDMPIDLNDDVCDFYHHMSKVRIDRIVGIETAQRRLEADKLIARGQRVSMIERIDSLRLENLKVHAMLDIKMDRMNSLRLHMSLLQEEFRQVRRDRDDTRERLRRTMTNTRSGMTSAAIEEMINQRVDAALEARRVNRDLELRNGNDNGGGDGNGNGDGNGTRNGNNGGDNGDGNENRNVNGRGDRLGARKCTYQDFMKCQPLSFKGTEGVVGLIRWSKKMKTVFHISNCPERYQVKYATCTLLYSALTWWNSHKRTIETDVAYALSWRELLKLMTEVYCLRNEIQKMETEL